MKNLILRILCVKTILVFGCIQFISIANGQSEADYSIDEGTGTITVYSTTVDEGACMGAYTDCARQVWSW
ncbi:hypothetical protein MM236_07935 [Belliella sp. DSM 107340]|uniref:Uncharacterized protein n=1 Tax=Belliella calami TaxID=2923436 RepID=A0ABS9UNH6_9BACT|nr:hypothetical protein [Belliella calami]MCH7397914.1 hypothetical protein [Belliella calami]